MELDLIDFYELRTHKEIVAELLRQQPNISLPIPIEKLAEAFGIKDILERPFRGMQGALVANPEKSEGIILVNSGIRNSQRKRFTLGHELGHFLLPNHGNEMWCSKDDISINSQVSIEREANEFASELLMPTEIFTRLSQFENEPDIQNIIDLAEMFSSSLLACGFKYTGLSDYPIATVSSKCQKVSSFWINSREVPFWLSVGKNDKIPYMSLTSSASKRSSGEIVSDIVDSSIWFDESKGFELPENLVEQTLVQENGYSYTLLWFEDEILEIEH